jgi:hypothetical protein
MTTHRPSHAIVLPKKDEQTISVKMPRTDVAMLDDLRNKFAAQRIGILKPSRADIIGAALRAYAEDLTG